MGLSGKKIFLFTAIILLGIAPSMAAIDSIAGTNIFPDSEVRFRDTEVIAELTADATTTTTVELWVQKPDETWFQANAGQSQTVTVKSGNPRKLSFGIESDRLDQYGNYDIKLNETNNGLNSTIQTELVPRPDIILSNPTNVRINGQQNTYFNLDINTFVGEKISLDELEPGNLTIYRITDNESTENVIEKTIEREIQLTNDTNSGDLEAYIDTTTLPEGAYELRADANITSCEVCEVYYTTTSDVINIAQDYGATIYNEKWGSFTANDILTNQGQLDEKVEENENKVDGVSRQVANFSTRDSMSLVWIWRGSVILILFIMLSAIIYYSSTDTQY